MKDIKSAIKVVKFGGSSLADAGQFRKVADIINAEEERRFVIASAPGKRNDGDEKVTDMLYACYAKAAKGDKFKQDFKLVEERFTKIIEDLKLDINLDDEFKIIRKAFAFRAGRDYAASRGEYLNGKILAAFLGYDFIDPALYIRFDEHGIFDLNKTIELLRPKLESVKNAVIPGFYGSMPNDTIKTFSRGGSDITGSIVANAANAKVYENWTDVSGFLICDPRIVPNPRPIKTVTYRELRELSYMGATVLHEDAIFPVRAAGIPINIKNTNAPLDKGTMIVLQTDEATDMSDYIITGIAGKTGFSIIHIEKDMMNNMVGFGKNVLRAFEKSNLNFEHMPSGIDTMSVIVNTESLRDKEQAILDEICHRVDPDLIDVEHGLALIAVVGQGMRKTRGTAGRIFAALAHARVNIKMIDQGSSELNIIIGVKEDDYKKAIKAIYDIFVLTKEED